MNVTTIQFAAALVLAAALMLPACKKDDPNATPSPSSATAAGTATSAPVVPAADGPDVAFKGTYKMFAQDTIKDGKHRHSSDVAGTGSVTIDKGVVTWVQDFPWHGASAHVSQIYTFTAAGVKPHSSGGFDVALTWQSIDVNIKNYNPDKGNARIEAQKQGTGWLVSLMTTDDKGVISGVEFK